MDVLAERARQALRLGSKDFEPTSLEAHHKMLGDLGQASELISKYHRAIKSFEDVTTVFLQSSSKVLVETPYPRAYYQTSLGSEAQPTFTPIPREHVELFTREVHEHLKAVVPEGVGKSVQHKLLKPIEHWLKAYESAKERVHNLDRGRLQYDSARRKVEASMTDTSITERERELRLIKREREHEAHMAHFEVEEANTYAQLLWLTSQGARIKAHLADLLKYMYTSALSHNQNPLILEPFPLRVLETPSEQLKRYSAEKKLAAPPAGPATSMEGVVGEEEDVPASEMQERKEHRYEGQGTGRKETRLGPEALHFGLGSAARRSGSLPSDVVGDIPPGMHDTSTELEQPETPEEAARAKHLQIIPAEGTAAPPPATPGEGALAAEETPTKVHRIVTSGKTEEGSTPEVTTRASVVATQTADKDGKGVAVVTTRTIATAEGGTPEEAAALANKAGRVAAATAGAAAQQAIEGQQIEQGEQGPSATERIKEGASGLAEQARGVVDSSRQAIAQAGAKTKEVLLDRPREALMNRYELAKERRQHEKEEELLRRAQDWAEKFGGALLLPLSQEELQELREMREELHRQFVLNRANQIQIAEELEVLWRQAEAAEAAQIESRTRALHATFAQEGANQQALAGQEGVPEELRHGRVDYAATAREQMTRRAGPMRPGSLVHDPEALLGVNPATIVQGRQLGATTLGGIEESAAQAKSPAGTQAAGKEVAGMEAAEPQGTSPPAGRTRKEAETEAQEQQQTAAAMQGTSPPAGRTRKEAETEAQEQQQTAAAMQEPLRTPKEPQEEPVGLVAKLQQTVQSESA